MIKRKSVFGGKNRAKKKRKKDFPRKVIKGKEKSDQNLQEQLTYHRTNFVPNAKTVLSHQQNKCQRD
jgi:hypothetical protein